MNSLSKRATTTTTMTTASSLRLAAFLVVALSFSTGSTYAFTAVSSSSRIITKPFSSTSSSSSSSSRKTRSPPPLVFPLDATSLLDPSSNDGGVFDVQPTAVVTTITTTTTIAPSSQQQQGLRGRFSSFLDRIKSRKRNASTDTLSASEVVTNSKVPSYRKLLVFASTTLLIWLSEPLLSLVDTTVVGWTQGGSSVVQLAAMGPATTLMDMLLYMTYFLALSTTSLVSQGIAEEQWRKVQTTTSHILAVAAVLGTGVLALLWSPLGPLLLKSMAGATATPELISYAVSYSRIRAAIAPLAVMGMVAQSFCLANLNTAAPALAVVVASVLNVSGDLALSHLGVVGAALATAVASSSASLLLLVAVKRKLNEWRKKEVQQFHDEQRTQAQQEQAAAAAAAAALKVEAVNVDEINNDSMGAPTTTSLPSAEEQQDGLQDEEQQQQQQREPVLASSVTTTATQEPPARVPFLSIPDVPSVVQLATISGPLAFNMIAKMGAYSALTLRTASFGVVPALAAHNVLMRLFYFFGCFADSMGMCAQAFLPAALYPLDKKAVRGTLRRLSIVALVTAAAIGQGSMQLLARAGHLLARDGVMLQAMQSQTLWLGAALFLHPLIVLTEGTVIAMRDFKNLIRTYACTILLHSTLLAKTTCFPGIWKAMVAFQLARMLNYKLWRTNRSKMHLETAEEREELLLQEAATSTSVQDLDAATASVVAP